MAKEHNGGLMDHFTAETGNLTKHREKGRFIMLMAMCTKGSGRMISPMGSESISILMVSYMKDSGKMINKMAGALKCGLMARGMKASLTWGSSLEKVYLTLIMVPTMKETSLTIKFMEQVILLLFFRNLQLV